MAPAAVIAVVKAVRTQFPKVDGIPVLVAALAAGAGLSWLFSVDGESIKQVILQGTFWGLAGSGFMAAADRLSSTVTQTGVTVNQAGPAVVNDPPAPPAEP